MNNPYIDELGNKIYKNTSGQSHRLDGPAREFANGYKEWWVNGKTHKLDGPAMEDPNGYKSWWIDHKKINSVQHFLALLET